MAKLESGQENEEQIKVHKIALGYIHPTDHDKINDKFSALSSIFLPRLSLGVRTYVRTNSLANVCILVKQVHTQVKLTRASLVPSWLTVNCGKPAKRA